MLEIVVPFRGESAKRRLRGDLHRLPELPWAMLRDVLEACRGVGRTVVVSASPVDEPGVQLVHDDGLGQGRAVAAALEHVGDGPVLIVNADLPCARAHDLRRLAAAIPTDGLALVEAADGTTNALGLARARLFRPLYGPDSAARFRRIAPSRTAAISNLTDDVDELDDVFRFAPRFGRHSRALLAASRAPAAS